MTQLISQTLSAVTSVLLAISSFAGLVPANTQLAQVGSYSVSPSIVSVQSSNISDTGNTETTASISWQSGDVIVVIGGVENGEFELNTPTGTGLNFSLLSQTNSGNSNLNTKVYLWTATASSNGSGTISSTRGDSGSGRRFITAYVIRGSGGIGNKNTITNSSSKTISLTRGGNNSIVIGGLVDWSALTDTIVNVTPSSGGTIDASFGDGASYGVFTFNWVDQGSAGTTSYGITNQTGTSKNDGVIVEILGTSGGGGSNTFVPSISSFFASPSSVSSGSGATLSWNVTGSPTPTLSINNGVGSVTGSSISVSPTQTTTYVLTASNSEGSTQSQTTVTVSATPAPTTYTLSVSKSGTGSGTVSGVGINCGSDCSETVNSGTQITLSASPSSGSTFTGWSGGGCSGTGNCTVTVNSNISVVANFNTSQIPPMSGNTVTAVSCSLSDVQSAVNAVSEGGTVLIPNGTCAWSGGISTTKQIIIRAQNYTPTPGGTAARSVTITNNSSSPLFSMQSGNNYHVGVGGIRFNEGTGDANAIRFTGSGSKVPLLFDSYFQNKSRFGSAADVALITWLAQGGVAWNIIIDGTGFGDGGDPGPAIASVSIHFKSPRSWYTSSTMGMLDTNGAVNVYFEDSKFINTGGGDLDDAARVVMRHSVFDGSVWITHGFTSSYGGRHWESYNNTYQVTSALRNHAGRYFWVRAGHGIFTDNVVNNASVPQNYGSPSLFVIGDNTSPGSYPMSRQPGWGHNGVTDVSDPIYSWNNTGTQANSFGFQNGWDSIVKTGRDVFVNAGAKPGYSKYTYPHPARAAVESGTTPPPTTTYIITASSGTGGTISPSGSVSVNSGSSQTFTITPNFGYQISAVTVNGSSVGTVPTYTFSNVTSNGTISAAFSQIPVSDTFSAGQRVQTTANLNVRSTASATGALLGTQSNGNLGTVISGGQSVDGYFWWNVNFDSGVDGFVVEEFLGDYVAPTAPVINTFSASPSTINRNESSTLSWNVSGATSLSISGIGTVTGTSRVVSSNQTTTYTLTATNAGGSVTRNVTVTVSSRKPKVIKLQSVEGKNTLTSYPEATVVTLSTSGSVLETQTLTANQNGEYTVGFSESMPSVVDIGVKIPGYLRRVVKGVNIDTVSSTIILPQLRAGDFNGDNIVNTLDLSTMTPKWNKVDSLFDLNGDGIVNTLDYSVMSKNWNQSGE